MAERVTRNKLRKVESERSQASTTKGHSASASSASQPLLFSHSHPLITTSNEGYSWKDFDTLDCSPCYNLEDLLTHVQFPYESRERYSLGVTHSLRKGCGYHAIAWVKSLIEKSCRTRPSTRLSYTSDIWLGVFEEALVTFLWSLDKRPDGVVLRSFQCGGKEWMLPLFTLEVHSSPYKNSVSHTAANVLEQLRLLRCFNANIRECVGFTFPKYADHHLNQTCVTKVTVSFEKFKFVVLLEPLKIENVQEEIVKALKSALTFQADFFPIFSSIFAWTS